MDHQRFARMFQAARLTAQARFREVTASVPESLPDSGGLPDMQSVLSHLRTPWSNTHSSAREARRTPPGPGQWTEFSYSNQAGRRDYKLYVPTGHRRQRVPLIVMLHGGTQHAEDFAAGTRMNEQAERHRFLVAYPEQSRAANARGYWNWFQPENQTPDGGEPSLIAGITHQVVERYGLDASSVCIAGFSAGGAMAAVMANAYPELYSAVGVHSGLPAGAAHDVPSAFAAMARGAPVRRSRSGRLIVFHGDNDQTVRYVNADALVAAALPNLRNAPPPLVTTHRLHGRHSYTRRIYSSDDRGPRIEQWTIHQSGHAWSGGSPNGSYTDPKGPDASAEFARFFAEQTLRSNRRRAA